MQSTSTSRGVLILLQGRCAEGLSGKGGKARMTSIFVPQGCGNKGTQTGWPATTEMCSLPVPESPALNRKDSRAVHHLKPLGETLAPPPPRLRGLPAIRGIPWLAPAAVQPLSLSSHAILPSHVCVPPASSYKSESYWIKGRPTSCMTAS